MTVGIRLEVIKINGGRLVDPDALQRIFSNTMTQAAKAVKVDFDVTTQTWDDRPKFIIHGTKFTRKIATDSDIYAYVNDGTKPHPIAAKSGGVLIFQVGYNAKTIARSIASRAGGSYGATAVAKEVRHPGTKAREFDKAIAEKWDKLLPEQFERAILAELSR